MMTKLPSGYPMMTKLITKDDPLYFSQTSNEPYDRHHYKLVFKEKYVILATEFCEFRSSFSWRVPVLQRNV